MYTKNASLSEAIHPLHKIDSFTNSVFDVSWSPKHPAVFATADVDGKLSFFNLTKDVDVSWKSAFLIGSNSIFLVKHQSPIASITEPHGRGLSRCRWHENGERIAIGTAAGDIQVYDVSKVKKKMIGPYISAANSISRRYPISRVMRLLDWRKSWTI